MFKEKRNTVHGVGGVLGVSHHALRSVYLVDTHLAGTKGGDSYCTGNMFGGY